ncbi:MAG: hypothetical protein KGL67_00710 [Patescibacteria group bacterium]|nr:hypothetical protein [Patescibacteria group bacterium]
MVALSASVYAQDDKPCVAPNVCVAPIPKPPAKRHVAKRSVRPVTVVKKYYSTTTTTVACCSKEIADLQAQINAIRNKPASERYPEDHQKIMDLLAQIKELGSRVDKTEEDIGVLENRVTTLENRCTVLVMTDSKGRPRQYDSCTRREIKTGGWSTTKTVVVSATAVGGTIGVLCAVGFRGFCRAGRIGGGGVTTIGAH